LKVKKDEKVLIIADQNKLSIAWALFDAAFEIGANVQLVRIPVAVTHGEEPPDPLPEYMRKFDAIIAPTTKSISHTAARRNASRNGVRIATMPDILDETFIRALDANYEEIAVKCQNLRQLMLKAKSIRVQSPSGTDITFSKKRRFPLVDTGILCNRGDFSNLPAGEVFVAPVEESAQGIIAFDGSMAGVGLLEQPLVVTIRDGYAQNVSGFGAEKLLIMLNAFGPHGHNLAEFGIGTNDKATLCGSPLEDEKVIGTVHFAFGDNITMGGKVAVALHIDGIIRKPSVWFDDQLIMENGAFAVTGIG
jgi:leucyl aminopeptidase (aminopeptidase T)